MDSMLHSVAGPISSVRAEILAWIDTADRDPGKLARWLQGRDLPPVGESEEPYIWILRAIPPGAARPRVELALAVAAASLVKQIAEFRAAKRGDRLLYNLLGLCSGLRSRDYLAAPLADVYRHDLLKDLYYGLLPLNTMLLPALIENQSGPALQGAWEVMLEGTGDPVLGGNADDGFRGILYMPPSEAERGKPAVAAIGKALTQVIGFLENRPDKVPLLRDYFKEVEARYPSHRWSVEFVGFSDGHDWPRWTDIALPDLDLLVGHNRYITWFRVAEMLAEAFTVATVNLLAGGRIREIIIPDEGIALYKKIARRAEFYRRRTSYGGVRAETGIVSAFCEEIKEESASDAAHSVAQSVQEDNTRSLYATTV